MSKSLLFLKQYMKLSILISGPCSGKLHIRFVDGFADSELCSGRSRSLPANVRMRLLRSSVRTNLRQAAQPHELNRLGSIIYNEDISQQSFSVISVSVTIRGHHYRSLLAIYFSSRLHKLLSHSLFDNLNHSIPNSKRPFQFQSRLSRSQAY